MLMWRPHGRTIPAFAGMTEASFQFVPQIVPVPVFSKEARRTRGVSIKKIPNFVLFVSFEVNYPTLYFAG